MYYKAKKANLPTSLYLAKLQIYYSVATSCSMHADAVNLTFIKISMTTLLCLTFGAQYSDAQPKM